MKLLAWDHLASGRGGIPAIFVCKLGGVGGVQGLDCLGEYKLLSLTRCASYMPLETLGGSWKKEIKESDTAPGHGESRVWFFSVGPSPYWGVWLTSLGRGRQRKLPGVGDDTGTEARTAMGTCAGFVCVQHPSKNVEIALDF